MKVTVLDIRQDTNSKTGETKHVALVLTDVSKYGRIVKQAIEVVIPSDFYPKMKVGDMDLDIVLPYSEYPYSLKIEVK